MHMQACLRSYAYVCAPVALRLPEDTFWPLKPSTLNPARYPLPHLPQDTSGPSLNILIKLMAVESLVFAPFFYACAKGNGLIFQWLHL